MTEDADASVTREASAAHDLASRTLPTADPLRLGIPLTERILARLGSPRWLWILLWGSAPLVTPVLLVTALGLTGQADRVPSIGDLVVSQAAFAYAVLVALWGIGRLIRGARALKPGLTRLVPDEDRAATIRRTGDIGGPILLTAAVMLVTHAAVWSHFGAAVAFAVLLPQTLMVLPLMTFVWTYLRLLISLARLGRARLALDPFPQDRTLGLGPVGSLAFTGFALLFALAVPVLVANADDPITTTVGLLALVGSVPVFFLSMWRLHRQMGDVKAKYIEEARRLYAAAYEPVRSARTVEALDAQARALGAAQALEERAHKILEWPVSEGITAVIGVIFVGVVTSLIVRLLFAAAGF